MMSSIDDKNVNLAVRKAPKMLRSAYPRPAITFDHMTPGREFNTNSNVNNPYIGDMDAMRRQQMARKRT